MGSKRDGPSISVEHRDGWIRLAINEQTWYLRPSEANALRDGLIFHGSKASDYRWDYTKDNGHEYVESDRPGERVGGDHA